jgi:hypothetical protein
VFYFVDGEKETPINKYDLVALEMFACSSSSKFFAAVSYSVVAL